MCLFIPGKQFIKQITPQRFILRINQSTSAAASAVQSNKQNFQTPQQTKFTKPVFKYARIHKDRKALRDKHGEYAYSGLLSSSEKFAKVISEAVKNGSDERVVFLCPNDASYVVTQWACWISGQIGKFYKSLTLLLKH